MTVFDPDEPFNELPPLPPKRELETKPILKRCVEARAALAALKQVGESIPNQSVLINTIPLLEAQASSEIENIVTTTDRLFQFADNPGNQADAATREALRYRTALYDGYQALKKRPLSTSVAVQVCRTIKDTDLDVRKIPGTTLTNSATKKTIYTPPAGETLLRDKLANWERFLHDSEELDPLTRMAVGHYQFEAIHPFPDGNGRTGRVLNILYLVDKQLLDIPVLYLSRYIIQHKSDYYGLLLEVTRKGDWDSWLTYMLDGVQSTADWTAAKIRTTRQLLEETAGFVREKEPAIYTRELVEQLFVQPYCRIGNLVDAGVGHRETVSKYLRTLCDIGVLEERKVGREKLFVNPRFLRLLTTDSNKYAKFA